MNKPFGEIAKEILKQQSKTISTVARLLINNDNCEDTIAVNLVTGDFDGEQHTFKDTIMILNKAKKLIGRSTSDDKPLQTQLTKNKIEFITAVSDFLKNPGLDLSEYAFSSDICFFCHTNNYGIILESLRGQFVVHVCDYISNMDLATITNAHEFRSWLNNKLPR